MRRVTASPNPPYASYASWRQVLPALRADAPGWAMQVPPVVTELIRNRGLFGFPRKEVE